MMSRLLWQKPAACEDGFYRLVTATSPRAYGLAFALLVCVVASTSALLFATGASHQYIYAADVFALLDGSARIMHGAIPHVDFYDVYGLTSYLPILVGMLAAGCKSEALAYGPAILLPIIALWTWQIARVRFSAVPALGVAVLLGGLIVATFPPGLYVGWKVTSYAENYNRFQWALICLLALNVLMEPRHALDRGREILEGISAGLLVGILLLGKANYSLAATVLFAAGILLRPASPWRRVRWFAALGGLAVVYGLSVAYAHGDFRSYWSDMRLLSQVAHSYVRTGRIVRVVSSSWGELAIPLFIVMIYLPLLFSGRQLGKSAGDRWRGVVAALLLTGAGGVIVLGNTQFYAVPAWALAGIILAEVVGRPFESSGATGLGKLENSGEAFRLRVCLAFCAAGISILSFCAADYGSVAYSFLWRHRAAAKLSGDGKIATPSMQCLLCPPASRDPQEIEKTRANMLSSNAVIPSNFEIAIGVNAGLELLAGKVDAKSRIFTMDYSNPFPFALELPAPRRAPIVWEEGFILDDAHHPPVEVILGDVTHIMQPKHPMFSPSVQFAERVFGEYMRNHFCVAAESDFWILYTRNPQGK